MRPIEFLKNLTVENPVLLKELRVGLREKRLFVTQIVFLVILLLVTLSTLPSLISNTSPEALPELGKGFFQAIFWVQLVVLGLITPGLTCGSLSGERERHSLDMVLASRLSSAEIVAGKLGYAFYYVILLLFSSLPIASVTFFFGGISPGEAFQSYVELICFGALAGLVGLFFSSRETRSNYATSLTYLTVFLSPGLLVFYGMIRNLDASLAPTQIPFTPMQLLGIFYLYSMLFLFVKTMHRLKPQAVNLRIIAWSFIAIYILWATLTGLALVAALQDEVSASTWTGFLVPVCIFHLLWVGMFCNDAELPSYRERQTYLKSWFSRNIFWMTFFAVALSLPVGLYSLSAPSKGDSYVLVAGCLLCALYVFSFPLIARALHALFPGEGRFPLFYFTLLALSLTLPSLGLLFESRGIFSGIYLSPVFSVISLAEDSDFQVNFLGAKYSSASLSALFYCGLAVVSALILQRRKRSAVPAASSDAQSQAA